MRHESSRATRSGADDTVFIADLYRLFRVIRLDSSRRAAYTGEATANL
jgi:hypothetical protein